MLRQARQTGIVKGKGLFFDLDLTMEELSTVIGASRQTVSTLLNGLIRENLIEKKGRGKYYILDPQRFEEQASTK